MREKILTFIEKNSRIDTQELAVILGVDETAVMNELEAMEQEGIICGYHTLINWDKAGAGCVRAADRKSAAEPCASGRRNVYC